MCTKTSQRNGQHKKSCAQQNVSFMKQIRGYKMPSELKVWVKLLLYKDSWMLHTHIWRHVRRKDVVDTQTRKVTDKIVASVFTKNK